MSEEGKVDGYALIERFREVHSNSWLNDFFKVRNVIHGIGYLLKEKVTLTEDAIDNLLRYIYDIERESIENMLFFLGEDGTKELLSHKEEGKQRHSYTVLVSPGDYSQEDLEGKILKINYVKKEVDKNTKE